MLQNTVDLPDELQHPLHIMAFTANLCCHPGFICEVEVKQKRHLMQKIRHCMKTTCHKGQTRKSSFISVIQLKR